MKSSPKMFFHRFDYPFQTQSDCEVLIPLFIQYGVDFVKKINGTKIKNSRKLTSVKFIII